MKILILSAATGGGHLRASRALQTYIRENTGGNEVVIADALKSINTILDKTCCDGYHFMATKAPRVFGRLYRATNMDTPLYSLVSRFNGAVGVRLMPLLTEEKPDVIISTHPFAPEMVSHLKGKGRVTAPLICLMTDYGPHRAWIAPHVDADGNEVVFGSSSMTSTEQNTIAFSIANPTVCISNMAQYYTSKDWLEASQGNDALWGNPLGYERDEDNAYPNKGSKSYYDPCPAGYRVPPADVFRSFTSSGGYTESFDSVDAYDISGDGQIGEEDYNCGWMFNMESGHSFFPAAARYDGSYAMLYGSVSGLWGSYWSNCPSYVTDSGGLGHACLSFSKQARGYTFSPSAGGSKADAYSVRCIKE